MKDTRFQTDVPQEEQHKQGEDIEDRIQDEHDVLRDARFFRFRRPVCRDPLQREHQNDIHEQDDQPAVKKKSPKNAAKKPAERKSDRSESKRREHKYGRNQGEGLSGEKVRYSSARYNKLFRTERYTRKTVQRDREYGMFWYDWLWHILRPVLCFTCALLVVLGMVSLVWNKLYNGYIAPRDKSDETPKAFTIASGESVTKIGAHLEEQGYISSASLFKY